MRADGVGFMTGKKVWIIVASATMARIFAAKNPHGLMEVEVLTHPESRTREHDLVSDRAGRSFASTGHTSNAMERPHTQHEVEEGLFALEICRRLEAARQQGLFSRLYLIANPVFLGILREHMDKGVTSLVVGEIHKNIISLKPEEVRKYLPDVL